MISRFFRVNSDGAFDKICREIVFAVLPRDITCHMKGIRMFRIDFQNFVIYVFSEFYMAGLIIAIRHSKRFSDNFFTV